MNIFSGIIVAFLPKRYRDAFTRFEVPSSASIISGFLELGVAFGLLVHSYDKFMNERLAATSLLLMERVAEKGGESAVASIGGFALVDFLFRITTVVFIFFVLEGSVRVIAAIAGRETVPTLPLKLLEYVQGRLSSLRSRTRVSSMRSLRISRARVLIRLFTSFRRNLQRR